MSGDGMNGNAVGAGRGGGEDGAAGRSGTPDATATAHAHPPTPPTHGQKRFTPAPQLHNGGSALATTYRISPTGVLFHGDRRNTVRAIMGPIGSGKDCVFV